jgi:hypothetical protein
MKMQAESGRLEVMILQNKRSIIMQKLYDKTLRIDLIFMSIVLTDYVRTIPIHRNKSRMKKGDSYGEETECQLTGTAIEDMIH